MTKPPDHEAKSDPVLSYSPATGAVVASTRRSRGRVARTMAAIDTIGSGPVHLGGRIHKLRHLKRNIFEQLCSSPRLNQFRHRAWAGSYSVAFRRGAQLLRLVPLINRKISIIRRRIAKRVIIKKVTLA